MSSAPENTSGARENTRSGAGPDGRVLHLVVFWLVASFLLPGCISSCDPAVVPMPEGYDDVNFNMETGDAIRRGAKEYGNKIVIWRDGVPIELEHRDKKKFRSYYESCDDTSLCDEVTYNFENTGDAYQLTLVRFGGPLLSVWKRGRGYSSSQGPSEARCDTYKALARELWDEPSEHALDGDMEIFEVNDRYWGAVLCGRLDHAHLMVGRKKRIQEMYD